MKFVFFAALFIVSISVVFSQTDKLFSADFRISRDPNVKGIINGDIFYDANGKKIRNNFVIGAVEIFNFTGSPTRFLGCKSNSVCDAETWREPMPIYYKEATDVPLSDTITGIDGRTCTGFNKSGNLLPKAVKTNWYDSTGKICRSDFVHPTNAGLPGKRIEFTNVGPIGNVNLEEHLTWPCPRQTCAKLVDFILAFDESGSIDGPSFEKEKEFAEKFALAFRFGNQGVAMSLIMFDNDARRIMPLDIDQNSVINYIRGVRQGKGSTCIGCGVEMATQDFAANGRSGVTKVLVVLTDGKNNVGLDRYQGVVQAAKDAGILIFTIGVDDYDLNQLLQLRTVIPNVDTFFNVTSFDALAGILNSFIASTCIDIPGNPCGTGCYGFCACGRECLCPDMCNDGNACTNDLCVNGTNGNGCSYSTKVCNDGNYCTIDGCNPSTGCTTTPVSCDDGNRCTNDTCTPSVGCQRSPVNCNDNNPCTAETCLPATGCNYTTVDCNKCTFPTIVTCPSIPCKINECNPADGLCHQKDIICDDNNACSTDSCNTTTGLCMFKPITCDDGNYCTHDSCDKDIGCFATDYNITTDCNDNSVCTIDSCNPSSGCVFTQRECSDGNQCTDDSCNSITGCTNLIHECSLDIPATGCTAVGCNTVTGCYNFAVEGLIQPECNKCVSDGPCDNIVAIASISGGVVAGIVIAGVAVFAAVASVSGRAGYLAYVRNKNNMQGAQMSPLYQDNGLSGTNPFHEAKA